MPLRNTADAWGLVSRAIHWLMFALIGAQIVVGLLLEDLPKGSALRGFAFDAHETAGVVALLLVFARLAWRASNPAPEAQGSDLVRRLAAYGHAALYALMIAIPVAGMAMVDLKGHQVAFFAWEFPDLLPKNEALARGLAEAHETFAWALVLLVAGHVAAALWHHVALKDRTLARMLGRA